MTIEPLRKHVTVNAPPEQAFEVFTDGTGPRVRRAHGRCPPRVCSIPPAMPSFATSAIEEVGVG